ncbi:MAG: DEAD/DEAH box helicase [Gemmatimonadetes bacterium]|nr:DEAD/DEAH box helicase [Gemmatimonadota bacterium]
MDRSTLIQDFLSELEQAEAALLTWGVVDGAFTHDEVVERARIFLEQRQDGEMRPTELIQHLQDRKLLFDLPGGASRLWRTRMAEGIRLIARLRQMFRFEEWRSGPTLVSDYRFALRPRSYPKRDVTFSAAMQAWESAGVLTAERRKGIVALLTRPGVSTLAGFQVRAAERVFRDLAIAQCRGMIVTVGTGSGKTLAFYLPAMIHIAGMIEKDLKYTKALALYPRNELLKDQFAEAYREARRLDDLLQASGKPRLTIGAFFGPTPKKAGEQEVGEKWAKGGRRVCMSVYKVRIARMHWRNDMAPFGHRKGARATRM